MTKINDSIILKKTSELFSRSGYEGFSIRKLAKHVPITPSVIYHYFSDQDSLLREMFDYINNNLGKKRKKLPAPRTAKEMLRQRIEFQLDNASDIVAVLKYYIAFRERFPKFKKGFVPDKSSLHIEEVLIYGIKTKEFRIDSIEDDAKVITHAVNGFLLEYYPSIPKGKERQELVEIIYKFIVRALI